MKGSSGDIECSIDIRADFLNFFFEITMDFFNISFGGNFAAESTSNDYN